MLLGKDKIQEYLNSGAIVCDPAPAVIEAVHIDLHLADDFWWPIEQASGFLTVDVDDPHHAYRYQYSRGVMLPPHGFVLARTIERAGTTVPHLCPFIETRSTLARWGIAAHVSAGWGDPGFCSHWTLEIYNHRNCTVYLPPAIRICSIGFHEVEGNDEVYTGRYNAVEFSHASMLPRRGNV